MAPKLHGFHYDEQKGRYFKITPTHAAPPGARYSSETVLNEERRKDLQKLELSNTRDQIPRIQTSSILKQTFHGRACLLRETGWAEAGLTMTNAASSRTAVWANVVKRHPILKGPPTMTRDIRYFIRDPATGAFCFSHANYVMLVQSSASPGLADGQQRVSSPVEDIHKQLNTVKRYSFVGRRTLGYVSNKEVYWLILDQLKAKRLQITSISISPTRCVLVTTLEDGLALLQLVPPDHFNQSMLVAGHRIQQDPANMDSVPLPLLDVGGAAITQPRSIKTIWSSAAGPHIDTMIFAVGTSTGVATIGGRCGIHATELEAIHWPTSEANRDTLSVDFWNHQTVLAGLRNGQIRLWDTRAGGANIRFQHPSCVTHIRRHNDNQVVVAGLENKLSIYDVRASKPFNQDESSNRSQPSQPVLTFPTYRNKETTVPRLGFDTYRNLIASGTEDAKLQIFDANSGKELKVGPGPDPVKWRGLPRCLKFVDNENSGEGLRLYVANGFQIDALAWH